MRKEHGGNQNKKQDPVDGLELVTRQPFAEQLAASKQRRFREQQQS